MDRYFLIDYENVGGDGLYGCKELKITDRIMIFFTKNAKKLDMTDIADHGDARLEMIEIPSGKQSVDIHIGSYIGYLAGAYNDKECFVQVVSKDHDFDNVISFWNLGTKFNVSRKLNIEGKEIDAVEAKPSAKKAGSAATVASAKKVSNSVAQKPAVKKEEKPATTKQVNDAELKQKLSGGGVGESIIAYVLNTINKHLNEKNGKQLIYRAIISKYGQEKGLQIYNLIKKSI